MMPPALVVLAQASSEAPSAGLWEQFGPWGAVLAAMATGLVWLAKDRARIQQQLDEERKTNAATTAELYDRVIASRDLVIPMLERTAQALEHAVEEKP